MGLSSTFFDFFSCAALGAASVFAIIGFVGIGIRRSSTSSVRYLHR